MSRIAKVSSLAMAALALLVFAAPASANWEKEGVETTQEETLELAFKEFGWQQTSSPFAGFRCNGHMDVNLIPGTRTGSVTAFTVANPFTDCRLLGGLGSVCTGVESVHMLGSWTVDALPATNELELTGFGLKLDLAGSHPPCPLSLEMIQGATDYLTIAVENPEAIGGGNLWGTVNNNAWALSGGLEAAPEGVYGWS